MPKIIKMLKKHKKLSVLASIFILIAIFAIVKNINKNGNEVSYETVAAQKDILINIISGTGQVYALDQVEIKPKVSGKISYINVKNGQKINRGDLLARLDGKDAEKDL